MEPGPPVSSGWLSILRLAEALGVLPGAPAYSQGEGRRSMPQKRDILEGPCSQRGSATLQAVSQGFVVAAARSFGIGACVPCSLTRELEGQGVHLKH